MTTSVPATGVAGPLVPTGHPVQRAGAWAVALLAGRDHPEDVDPGDLDTVAERLTADIVSAATAAKETAAYDWWKVLFALYPNSKATHSKRSKDPEVLKGQIAGLFSEDPVEARKRPCTFCAHPAGVLWAKANLPLFDTDRMVNTLPQQTPGWPVCRACRITMWAMPYGARVTAGSAAVLTCDDERVEREFAQRNVDRSGKIRQGGFSGLGADAGPERVTLEILADPAISRLVGVTLWIFKNDNQEPWLRVATTRLAVARFLRRMQPDRQAFSGWRFLERALTRRDADGAIVRSGADAAARTLFDWDDRQTDGLLRALRARAERTEQVSERVLLAWAALSRLYLKEMHDMNVSELKPAVNVLVEWITAEQNPRGRFLQYRDTANYAYKLQQLLMKALARLVLDGHRPADVSAVTATLLADSPQGWRMRGQLFFEVVAELVDRDVPIGKKAEPGDDEGDDTEMPSPSDANEEEDP